MKWLKIRPVRWRPTWSAASWFLAIFVVGVGLGLVGQFHGTGANEREVAALFGAAGVCIALVALGYTASRHERSRSETRDAIERLDRLIALVEDQLDEQRSANRQLADIMAAKKRRRLRFF